MHSEHIEPKIESDFVTTSARGTRRTVWSVMAIVLLVGYTAGFFTRPMFRQAGSSVSANPAAVEVDRDMPLTESYQRLKQQVAELSRLASRRRSPDLEESVEKLTQEINELRTLNPHYRFQEIKAATIPAGVPAGYGEFLQVSFDEVQSSMNILRRMDPTYGADKLELQGPDLERYIWVGEQTACRYCCGAPTLVLPDGKAACRCEHSQAMRGLAAYLILEQGDRYSSEEIVAELNKWRATYFPKQTLGEALLRMKQAGEPGIEELEAEFPEFMPDMVGEC